jgi:hypothetical protein
MHDLVRLYATEHHSPTERDAALRRVLDFYAHTAHTAHAADHLLDPHRPAVWLDAPVPGTHAHEPRDMPAAMAWFRGRTPQSVGRPTDRSHAGVATGLGPGRLSRPTGPPPRRSCRVAVRCGRCRPPAGSSNRKHSCPPLPWPRLHRTGVPRRRQQAPAPSPHPGRAPPRCRRTGARPPPARASRGAARGQQTSAGTRHPCAGPLPHSRSAGVGGGRAQRGGLARRSAR